MSIVKGLYALGVLEGFVSRSTMVPQNVWAAITEIRDALVPIVPDYVSTPKKTKVGRKKSEDVEEEVEESEDETMEYVDTSEAEEAAPKKERKRNSMSPVNKAKAGYRMKHMLWRKRKEAALSKGEPFDLLEPEEPDWDSFVAPGEAVASVPEELEEQALEDSN